MKHRLSLIFISVSFCLLVSLTATAAPTTLSISPPKVEIVVAPGKPTTHTIRLTNSEQIDMNFIATVMDFAPSDKSGGIDVSRSIEGHSAINWFRISPTEFTLKPNQSQIVEVTITPPVELIPGSYFAVVMMQSQKRITPAENTNNDTEITPWIGSLFFLRNGEIGQLDSNALSLKTIEYPRIHFGGNLPVTVEVENHTSFHLSARTAFQLKGFAGFGSTDQSFGDEIILPQSSRLFQLALNVPTSGFQRGNVHLTSGSFNREINTKSMVTITQKGILLLIGLGIIIDIILRNIRNTHHIIKQVHHHQKQRKLKSKKKHSSKQESHSSHTENK
jgi:P pilus assembly chaperone PapD